MRGNCQLDDRLAHGGKVGGCRVVVSFSREALEVRLFECFLKRLGRKCKARWYRKAASRESRDLERFAADTVSVGELDLREGKWCAHSGCIPRLVRRGLAGMAPHGGLSAMRVR